MTWVKLDDSMPEHPKIAVLGHAAFHLHIEGLCYAARNLSDGYIPAPVAKRMFTGAHKAAAELVARGVWDAAEGGYQIHDYLDYQPSKEKVLALREVRSNAGSQGGRPPKQTESKEETNELSNEKPKSPRAREKTPQPGPSPTPSPSGSTSQPPEGQSGLVARIDHEIRNGSDLSEGVQSAIFDLVAQLPDATDGTVGRLVKLAKRGAGPAAFHDPRQGIAETSPRHPSRVACRIVEEHLEAAR
jgi:hypothetical protein